MKASESKYDFKSVMDSLSSLAIQQKKLCAEIKDVKSCFLDFKTTLRRHKKEMTSKEVRDYLAISKGKLTLLKKAGLLELSNRKRLGKIKGDYYYADSVIMYKQNQ